MEGSNTTPVYITTLSQSMGSFFSMETNFLIFDQGLLKKLTFMRRSIQKMLYAIKKSF
jgi:hypothetical protein